MPKRTDIKRVLVIGSGPIVIGQACEFDYSGTQAIKALRSEGLEVILVNSNPATIMTDPELSDRTYVEPLTPEALEKIIEKERPDAILPTVGGQTALNLAVQLDELGILKKYQVELIGASIPAIKVAEDRLLFAQVSLLRNQPDDALKHLAASASSPGERFPGHDYELLAIKGRALRMLGKRTEADPVSRALTRMRALLTGVPESDRPRLRDAVTALLAEVAP